MSTGTATTASTGSSSVPPSTTIPSQKLRLLVHVTAPTNTAQDNKYRADANGVLSFVTATRYHVGTISWPSRAVLLVDPNGPPPRKRLAELHNEEHSPTKRSNTSFDSLSSFEAQSTPYGALKSVNLQLDALTSEPYSEEEEEFLFTGSLNSSIPDSQPVYILPAVHTSSPALPQTPVLVPSTARSPLGLEQQPALLSPSPAASPSSYGFAPLSTGALLQFSTPAPRASSLPKPNLTPPAPSQTTISTLSSPKNLIPFNTRLAFKALVPGPYFLLPPVPETCSNPPQIPAPVDKLVNGHGLLLRYDNLRVCTTRELRKWERGYWRVDMHAWGDLNDKVHFWKLLSDNVVNGRLGQVTVDLEQDQIEVVRVYCWGGAARAVWAMLYVYSFKRVAGMIWISSGGEEIVRF